MRLYHITLLLDSLRWFQAVVYVFELEGDHIIWSFLLLSSGENPRVASFNVINSGELARGQCHLLSLTIALTLAVRGSPAS